MEELDPDDPNEWESLVEMGSYASLRKAQEHALVVLAMNQPCWISRDLPGSGFTLHIEPDHAERIRQEIEAYESEQPATPSLTKPEDDRFQHGPGWGLYFLWAGLLVIIHLLKINNPMWVELGASDNEAMIQNHEWWRPFTALFLHADTEHLLGNLLSGLLFSTLVARSIGPLRAWLLILLCGTLGNITTALTTWPEAFRSIGASTAVFGALGLLSGIGFANMFQHRFKLSWTRVAAPIIAGLVILGWFGGGTPGGNTDVLGHIFGFLAGLLLGGAVIYFKSPATHSSSP